MTDERDTKGREREESRAAEGARKERVLHTRVPAVLEDELKRLATNLRMPVSNVVRAILEDAIEAVEVVGVRAEDELKGFVHRLAHQREAIRQGAVESVQRAQAKSASASPTEARPTEARPADVGEARPSAARPSDTDEAPASDASDTPSCPSDDASLEAVLGFQRLVLRADAPCTVCGRVLARGTEACRGVRDDGGPRVLVGARCALVPSAD